MDSILKGHQEATADRIRSRPKQLMVSVGDREAVFYDPSPAWNRGGAQILVLAMHSRKLQDSELKDACERVAWYTKRWGIEVFHRTLKSGGCNIE